MRMRIAFLSLCALLLSASILMADTNRLGTAGAMELRIPVGARATALSGAVLADVKGPEALYWNPAGAAGDQHMAMFSRGNWFADVSVTYFGITTAAGGIGNIGVSAKVLELGEWEQTTEAQPEGTGVMVKPSFWVLGLSYAKQMTDRVAFGTTLNLVNESVMSTSARGIALDFGFQYVTPVQGLNFGIVLKSIGPDMRFDGANFEQKIVDPNADPNAVPKGYRVHSAAFELPSNIMFGVSYKALKSDSYSLNVNTDAQFNNHSEDEFRLGGEFAYNNLLFLRGGFVGSGQDDYLFKATFGAGLKLNMGGSDLTVDYSYVPMEYFDAQNWLSLRIGF